jgi:hypothetical protein
MFGYVVCYAVIATAWMFQLTTDAKAMKKYIVYRELYHDYSTWKKKTEEEKYKLRE